MILFHYTSFSHLSEILEDGIIKTTNSNLLEPTNMHVENHVLVSDTDWYKPVVWFSSELDFENANNNGLGGGLMDKTEVAIAIDTTGPQMFYKWDEWAIRNNIQPRWFERLKRTGPNWRTWYISERPVQITDTTRIIPRPGTNMDKFARRKR